MEMDIEEGDLVSALRACGDFEGDPVSALCACGDIEVKGER
jgi:hypothetical protein